MRSDAGNRLLVGSQGASEFALLTCPDGRRLATAALPNRLAAPPVMAAADTRALAITEAGELLSFEIPSMRRVGVRALPMRATQLAASQPDGFLLAVGGNGATPLAVVDARSLGDVHIYRPDKTTVVSAIGSAAERSSFVIGFAEPPRPAEVWEIAYGADAPPVFGGLVHDYRMGEAIALPGRFTPRVAPVPTPTAALVAGARASEWLRIGSDGAATVFHLEVRREIARLPESASHPAQWLAAVWQVGEARGWLMGTRGGRSLQVLKAGDDWRVRHRIALPAPLLAMREFGDDGSAVLVLESDSPTAAPAGRQRIELARVDARTMTLRAVPGAATDARSVRRPVRLERSRDGRCIALLDAADSWIAATLRRD